MKRRGGNQWPGNLGQPGNPPSGPSSSLPPTPTRVPAHTYGFPECHTLHDGPSPLPLCQLFWMSLPPCCLTAAHTLASPFLFPSLEEEVLTAFLGLTSPRPHTTPASACHDRSPSGVPSGSLGLLSTPFLVPCKQLPAYHPHEEKEKEKPAFDSSLPVAETHKCVVFASCFSPSPGSRSHLVPIHTWLPFTL